MRTHGVSKKRYTAPSAPRSWVSKARLPAQHVYSNNDCSTALGPVVYSFVTNTMVVKKKKKKRASSRKEIKGKKVRFSESEAKAAAAELGRLTCSDGQLPRWQI